MSRDGLKTRLSIVILTHNSRLDIEACLASVFRQGLESVEVIVVDNASTDGTREILGQDPRVRWLANQVNLGASKARNQGIEFSSGEWILTLDSDVVLENGFLARFFFLAETFSSDVGMVQSNMLSADGERVSSHGIYLSVIRRFSDINHGRPRGIMPPRRVFMLGPCSAAAFYRRQMLDEIREETGYFDERFFFLVEDVDLAWRARRAGWKAIFCPDCICFHHGNGSGTDRQLRQYLSFRNRYWMIHKNESLWGRLRVYGISWPYEILRLIYLFLFNRYFRGGFRAY